MSTASTKENSPSRTRPERPGWPEILAGGAVYVALYALVAVLLPLIEDDGVAGVVGLLVSGAMGIIALAAAVLIRVRGLAAFGVRRAKARYVIIGAALGLGAYALLTVTSVIVQTMNGPAENVQGMYQAGAAGGVLSLVVTLIAGSLITPLGEEAFFRGVIANALLSRYGAWVGIIGSAAVFAIAHGVNIILPIAFVVGILTALLFRRTGSIWPGFVLHAVNNALSLLVPVVLAAILGS